MRTTLEELANWLPNEYHAPKTGGLDRTYPDIIKLVRTVFFLLLHTVIDRMFEAVLEKNAESIRMRDNMPLLIHSSSEMYHAFNSHKALAYHKHSNGQRLPYLPIFQLSKCEVFDALLRSCVQVTF